MEKPSSRYIKHGWLMKGEYRPDIHNFGKTMDERNIKSHDPLTRYYTPEEMEQIKQEIRIAECPICLEEINDDRCRVCEYGHKFHNKCSQSQTNEIITCPVCRSESTWSCNNMYTDIASGGKKTKIKRKHNVRTRKMITTRKMYKKRNLSKKTNKRSRRAI